GFVRGNARQRPIHLFFGMRHPDSDFFYGEEMPAWTREGRLTRLVTAVSRGAGPHHVQDALRGDAAQVVQLIRDGARVMVCGGRDMAAGVADAVAETLAPAGLTAAVLRAEGRYVEDLYYAGALRPERPDHGHAPVGAVLRGTRLREGRSPSRA